MTLCRVPSILLTVSSLNLSNTNKVGGTVLVCMIQGNINSAIWERYEEVNCVTGTVSVTEMFYFNLLKNDSKVCYRCFQCNQ